MARLIGPDESVRVVYLLAGSNAGKASAQGAPVVIYTDVTLTATADIQSLAGVTVAASTLTVDAYSKIPLFLFPDGVDTVWTSINGGPAVPLYARTDDRLDTLGARVTVLEVAGGGGGGAVTSVAGRAGAVVLTSADVSGVETTTGSQSKATAAQAAAVAASAQRASNLSDLASAATSRTNLGLSGAALLPVGTAVSTVAAGDDSRILGAAQKSSNLSDLASAPAARTNLGLGAAASLPVGTSASTLAAGDDARIVGAAQKSSNLSDLGSATTARTNLGLGAAAALAVGTTTGTVAAGDDSRILGAAQKSSNLSDLGSATSARTNLGLGGSSTLAVGTTAGTVAAGNDPRLSTYDTPANHGLVEWNFPLDSVGAFAGTSAIAGTIFGMTVNVLTGTLVSNVVVVCGTVAVTLTAGQCLAVVVNSAGVELARTGDISALFAVTGPVTLPLTSTFTPTAGSKLCVLLLFNGTTPPALVRSSSTGVLGVNLGMTATSPRRYFTAGTAQTAVITPVTMSGTTLTGALTFWVGLS